MQREKRRSLLGAFLLLLLVQAPSTQGLAKPVYTAQDFVSGLLDASVDSLVLQAGALVPTASLAQLCLKRILMFI